MTHVLITGVGRGLGRATAEAALARGWMVTGTVRDGTAPEGVTIHRLDVTDRSALYLAASETGPVDILINNAGTLGPESQTPLDMDFGGFARTLAVNTLAPLSVVQAFLGNLRASDRGRILSISSQMSWMGYAKSDAIAYRASKVALNKVMQGLATDLTPEGIAVALVDPGWVRTDMGGPEAARSVEEGADTAVWLATIEDDGPSGGFFRDRAPIAW